VRSLHDVNKKKAYRGDCHFACFNSVTAERILIKFHTKFTPLEAIPSTYFLLTYTLGGGIVEMKEIMHYELQRYVP
jgi:hypothetical protein